MLVFFILENTLVFSQVDSSHFDHSILPGAFQTQEYASMLAGKRVAVVGNATSVIGKTHLVDSLLKLKINVVKIFVPEHGFRGTNDAGETVNDSIDTKTGLAIISIYGNHKKPTQADLQNVDVVIFDLQDVGVRFFTYLSTLHYVMEACAENYKSLIVLDCPNPNGFYVDGPVLEKQFSSFIGLDPVPIVYGMTIGEYAEMLNGEGWLANSEKCNLTVILCKNYDHKKFYELPVNPSPNLSSMRAIYLYPSLCLFEGTIVSVGRGTNKPFQIFGYPNCKIGVFSFTPENTTGAKNPPYLNQKCIGFDLSTIPVSDLKKNNSISLQWVLQLYNSSRGKDKFFTSYFNFLAGTDELQKQIQNGLPENEIRNSWENELSKFKIIRKKYLLYPDFY
jgi:uncharacterized protein YbbC (DUF1343 family)